MSVRNVAAAKEDTATQVGHQALNDGVTAVPIDNGMWAAGEESTNGAGEAEVSESPADFGVDAEATSHITDEDSGVRAEGSEDTREAEGVEADHIDAVPAMDEEGALESDMSSSAENEGSFAATAVPDISRAAEGEEARNSDIGSAADAAVAAEPDALTEGPDQEFDARTEERDAALVAEGVEAGPADAAPDADEEVAAASGEDADAAAEQAARIRALQEEIERRTAAYLAAIEDEIRQLCEHEERLQKDFNRYRARTEEQRPQWAVRARAAALKSFLTAHDDLHRWLDAAPSSGGEPATGHAYEALLEGAELVCGGLAAVVDQILDEALSPPSDSESAASTMPTEAEPETEPEALEAKLNFVRTRLRRTSAAYRSYVRQIKRKQEDDQRRARAEVADALGAVVVPLRKSLDDLKELDSAADPARASEQLAATMEEASSAMERALGSFDVCLMEVMYHPFNVERHEAVGRAPALDKAPGTVIHEVRRGYLQGDRVLRYAQVIVAA